MHRTRIHTHAHSHARTHTHTHTYPQTHAQDRGNSRKHNGNPPGDSAEARTHTYMYSLVRAQTACRCVSLVRIRNSHRQQPAHTCAHTCVGPQKHTARKRGTHTYVELSGPLWASCSSSAPFGSVVLLSVHPSPAWPMTLFTVCFLHLAHPHFPCLCPFPYTSAHIGLARTLVGAHPCAHASMRYKMYAHDHKVSYTHVIRNNIASSRK